MKMISALILCVSMIFSQKVDEKYDQDGRYWNKTISLDYTSKDIKRFDLSTSLGEIKMRPSKKSHNYIVITLSSQERDKEDAEDDFFNHVEVSPNISGNEAIIDVEYEGGKRNFWGNNGQRNRIKIEIYVKENIKLDVQTRGGSIIGENITAEIKAKTSGGSIIMDDINGDINVRTSGGSLTFSNIKGEVTGDTSGGGISAESIKGNLEVKTSGGGIKISNIGGFVNCRTSGGAISVENVTNYLRASTSGGAIRIKDIGSKANVSTSGGSIKFTTVKGDFSAQTSGGSIIGRDVRGFAELSTSSGRIRATEMKAPVVAESNGDIEIEMDLSNYTGSESTYLSNSFGNIELTITENSSFELDLRARSYGRSSKNIQSEYDLNKKSNNRASYRNKDGKHEIKVDARGGKIKLYKK